MSLLRNSKGQTARPGGRRPALERLQRLARLRRRGRTSAPISTTLARRNPQLTKLEVLGHTGKGREIIALKLTQGAREMPDGTRPAVLYTSTQHAREWISAEVNRRLLTYFIDAVAGEQQDDQEAAAGERVLVRARRQPGRIPVHVPSPDTRLWRKNLRDNNGNGTTEVGDGVDPNRNYPEHWNYDNEGSSGVTSSDTYRGPARRPSPRRRRSRRLTTASTSPSTSTTTPTGQWLLYPVGLADRSADRGRPDLLRLSGNLDNPAVAGFHPGLSSDVLYVTNGETTDFAHTAATGRSLDARAVRGLRGLRLRLPGRRGARPGRVRAEPPVRARRREVRARPRRPGLAPGDRDEALLPEERRHVQDGPPACANFTFDVSYGDPQEVRVLAKRGARSRSRSSTRSTAGRCRANRPRSGTAATATAARPTSTTTSCEGLVTDTSPDDTVKVWFEGRAARRATPSRTRRRSSRTTTCSSSRPRTTPAPRPCRRPGRTTSATTRTPWRRTASATTSTTSTPTAARLPTSSASSRTTTPSSGTRATTSSPVSPAGSAGTRRGSRWTRCSSVRAYLNEGGKAPLHGQVRRPPVRGAGTALRPDAANAHARHCRRHDPALPVAARLGRLSRRRARVLVRRLRVQRRRGPGRDRKHLRRPRHRHAVRAPTLVLQRRRTARTTRTSELVHHDERDPAAVDVPAVRELGVGALRPAGRAVRPAHGRLTTCTRRSRTSRTSGCRGRSPSRPEAALTFWTSYDTEADWDHLFVEARTVGQDDWTTLPDVNGHTTRTPARAASQATPAAGGRCTRGSTTTRRRTARHVLADGHDRRLERRLRRLRRLAAVAGRPRRLRRQPGRDLDLLRQRLGHAGPRRLRRRHRACPTARSTSFEGCGHAAAGRHRAAARQRAQPEQLRPARPRPASRRAPTVTTEDTLYMGFGFEGITGADTPRRRHGPGDGSPARPVTAETENHEGGASAPPSPSLARR